MKKSILLSLTLLAALGLGACDSAEKDQAPKTDSAGEVQPQAKPEEEAAPTGEALVAELTKVFEPTAEEKTILEAGPAVNTLGTVNGFFTNPQGVSGYFQNYEAPFNFIWSGKTESHKAFDGQVYQVMIGPGLMILKYMDDDKLLQRYDGESRWGLLDGFGEQWSRNNTVKGHHYYSYRGELKHDQMDGRGTISDYDFGAQGTPYIRYEGELKNSLFHGHGRAYNLTTGEMIRKGLWLAGEPFEGTDEEWREAVAEYELENAGVQYRNVWMTDNVAIDGMTAEGEEEITIIPPREAEEVTAVDQTGHKYVFSPGSYLEELGYDGEWGTVLGSREKRPLADYPLTIDLSYKRNGKKHYFRYTALRPFSIVLEASGPGFWPEKIQAAPETEQQETIGE